MLSPWSAALFIGTLLLPLGLRSYLLRYKKKKRIADWQSALQIPQHLAHYDTIYRETNGFLLSQEARQQQNRFEYTYGEIDFCSFVALIGLTHPDKQTRFYDLGCGVGKAVIACAMVYDVAYACGIEILPPLHQAADQSKQALSTMPHYAEKMQRIDFIQEDFLKSDLQSATLIFINAAGFIGPLWQSLCDKLIKNATHATIIVASKTLPDSHFSLYRQTLVEMSWGIVQASIYHRI